MDKVKNWGQVWTPQDIVSQMVAMSKNTGSILEPSAGIGVFTDYIKNHSTREITSIEIDPDNWKTGITISDFFDFSEHIKFPTIIGNPPYVAFKNITKETLKKIQDKDYLNSFDARTNLYLFFIRKSIEHLTDDGEIIFITPREFIKATSSIGLNNYLYQIGTITDWYEYGDQVVFKGYSPTVVIWRFQKGDFSRKTNTNDGVRKFTITDGQLSFVKNDNLVKFNSLFTVKVGAVSGADEIFTSESGNQEFVCSYTKTNDKLKKMFWNIKHPDLLVFKDKLISRKIKKFDENNWWHWGRGLYESQSDRIYVNCKTRDSKPFFWNQCKFYDGSVLAIFPKKEMNIQLAISLLNSVDWNELGFKVGGRLCFSQKSLENTQLPESFKIL